MFLSWRNEGLVRSMCVMSPGADGELSPRLLKNQKITKREKLFLPKSLHNLPDAATHTHETLAYDVGGGDAPSPTGRTAIRLESESEENTERWQTSGRICKARSLLIRRHHVEAE
jgi:hypothetical protein